MAELLKLLDSNGALKSGLMETLASQSSTAGRTSPAVSTLSANLNLTNLNESPRSTSPTTHTTGSGNINEGRSVSPSLQEQNLPFCVDPNANCLSDVDSVLKQVKEKPSEARRLLIAQVTDTITEAHMATSVNTQAKIREAKERIARQQAVTPQHMPDLSKISTHPENMWQNFINAMLPSLLNVVNFTKKLPGFTDLDSSDQVNLIKQGIFEVMVTRKTMLIDHVDETMIDPGLKMRAPRSVVQQMSPFGAFIDQFFEVAKKRNPLDLTDGEQGLFTAILMLCPDRKGLKNSKSVSYIQELYLQALYQLLRHNHKDAEEMFCNLLSIIPIIRKINDDHFRLINNIKQKSPTEFDAHFPPLHKELFIMS